MRSLLLSIYRIVLWHVHFSFYFFLSLYLFVCKVMRNTRKTVIDLEKELYEQNRLNERNLENHNNKILENHKQKMYAIEIRLDSNFNWCYFFVRIWIECTKGIFVDKLKTKKCSDVQIVRSFELSMPKEYIIKYSSNSSQLYEPMAK